MTTTDVTQVRASLQAELEDFQRQLDELDVKGPDSPDFDENFADSAQVAAEQGENTALANHFRDQIREIEAAVERLDEGTYGRCEVCDTEIAPARLEAMPATRFCIEHA